MIIWVGIAFILLFVVLWNNYRVSKSRRARGQRSFRKSYYEKRKRDQDQK